MFLDQSSGLVDIPEFSCIESTDRPNGGFLGILLRYPRSNLHPAKHLLVKSFLFDSWGDFWSSYLEMSDISHKSTLKTYNGSEAEFKLEALISSVNSGRMSLAGIARSLDLPYNIARYWVRRAGIRYVPPANSR
jgi:hypothetical protein